MWRSQRETQGLWNFVGVSPSNLQMRRFIRTAGMTPLTFVLGVLVTIVWWQLFPRRVSLCTLARNPAAYDGKRIRVEALGLVLSSPRHHENSVFISEQGCSVSNAQAIVQLDPSFESSQEVDDFVNSHIPGIREANVVIEGLFDEWATSGCYGPQFGIKNATMKLVSPVTSKPLPKMRTRN